MKVEKKRLTVNAAISSDFTMLELETAIRCIKNGKTAGWDGVYPEFIHHFGLRSRQWILQQFNQVLQSGSLLSPFKKAKVLAVLKPGKDGTDASHFRPISLLSTVYKFFEHMILHRIEPIIDEKIPKTQAGFRKNRNCTEQVMALTCFIETGFQKNWCCVC